MAKKKTESFEALLAETEGLVEALQAGDMPLEESLKKYEKGIQNLRACAKLIDQAEKKVKVLIEEAEKTFSLQDLDGSDLDDEEE